MPLDCATGPAALKSTVSPGSLFALCCSAQMKDEPKTKEKVEKVLLPGEGDPFSAEAIAYSEANKDGGSAFQPRGISDATVIDDAGYIENEDEPWHSTCRPGGYADIATLAYVPRTPPGPTPRREMPCRVPLLG